MMYFSQRTLVLYHVCQHLVVIHILPAQVLAHPIHDGEAQRTECLLLVARNQLVLAFNLPCRNAEMHTKNLEMHARNAEMHAKYWKSIHTLARG